MIILAGGLLVIDGPLSLGGFITYNLYLAMLIWPLRMIGMWIGQYQRAVASRRAHLPGARRALRDRRPAPIRVDPAGTAAASCASRT